MYQLPLSEKARALAQARTRYAWNERFVHWERPASPSEEDTIDRAARMIRAALAGREKLVLPYVEVNAQGSYFNNTNVRIESDMDIRVDWLSTFLVVTDGCIRPEQLNEARGYLPTGRSIADDAAEHRLRIWRALHDAFGADQVSPGSKALKLNAVRGSRAPADVVPTVRCVYAVPLGAGLLSFVPREIEGIAIIEPNGSRTINFPIQHHAVGKLKHEDTRKRYKKAVRILKVLRDELIDLGRLQKGQVPSFLIECLVAAVPVWAFLVDEDRYDRVRRALALIGDLLTAPNYLEMREVNGIKPLFAPFLGRPQPWRVEDARKFVALAWARLEA